MYDLLLLLFPFVSCAPQTGEWILHALMPSWENFCSTFKGECVERHPFHTYGKPKVRREQLDTPIAPFSLRLFSSRDCLRR